MNARDRYRNDPTFARLVDMMRHALRECSVTPSECREALMLAVYCEEMENPMPIVVRLADLERELVLNLEVARTRDESRLRYAAGPPATEASE